MRGIINKLLNWEWVLLLILLPIFLFPMGINGAIIILIPVLWVLRKISMGRAFPPTPYNLAVIILIFTMGLSFLVTFDLALTLPRISMLLVGIALMFATVHHSRESSIWPVVATYMFIGLMLSIIGLIGTQWPAPFNALNQIRRTIGIFPHGMPGTTEGVINANELAGVLCWIAPFMLACVVGFRKQLWQGHAFVYVALILSTAICSMLILATSSRGGIFAFGVSAMLVVAFFVNGRWRLVLTISLLVIILVLFSNSNGLNAKDIVGDDLGLDGRIEIWSRALLALQDHPLTGLGMNGFRRIVHVLYPLFGISNEIDLGHAHNHLLQIAMDLGLPGLISYLSLWIISAGLLWATYRNLVRRRAQQHPYYALVAGLSGALCAGWLFGVFDAVALGSRPSFMWWLLLGMTASTHYTVVFSGIHLRNHRHSKAISPTDHEPEMEPIQSSTIAHQS